MLDVIFGRLTWDSIILVQAVEQPNINTFITASAAAMMPVGGVMIVALLTWMKWWKPLFEWLTSVDHKKIGTMYIIFAVIMLFRGVVEGILMRTNQAVGLNGGFLSSDHFNQLFTTHGTNMIFFVAMPFLVLTVEAALRQHDRRFEDAARTLGCTEPEVLWRVSIPLAWRGLVAGAALGFARAVGEFGATVMVAGNVPGRTQTASLAVYDAVQAGRLADAATLSAVLAAMTGAVLLFVTRWGRR